MLEYLKNNIWLKIFAFSTICTIILYVFAALTNLAEVSFIAYIATIFSIFSLAITVYLCLKRTFNFSRLISIFVFFIMLSGILFLSNILFESEYIDMAWRYSLAIGGIIILIQIFLLFFGKGTSKTPANDVSQSNIIENPPSSMNNQNSVNISTESTEKTE